MPIRDTLPRKISPVAIKPVDPGIPEAAKPVKFAVFSCQHQSSEPANKKERNRDRGRLCQECSDEKKRQQEAANDARRLPHGSAFHMAYDATKKSWYGILLVPGMKEIQAETSGVFAMLRQLDDLYRKAIAPESKEA